MLNIPKELKDAIKNDKLVIFAGAGTSMQFGFPDWKTLVNNVLKNIDSELFNGMTEGLNKGWLTPINALDTLVDKHRTEILKELSNSFKINNKTDLSKHKKILTLSSKIITTNFDKAFENAEESPNMIPYKSSFKISQLQGEDKYIFKIHGCIDYPEDCILSSEQYEKHYSSNNTSIFELKKIISENTILFIGFSMSDPYVKSVFNFINSIYDGHSKKHFLITADNSIEKDINLINVETLVIDNYNASFDNLLNELVTYKLKKNGNKTVMELQSKPSKPSICILYPYSIDRKLDYNPLEIANSFKKYDVTVDIEYLSIENVRELKPYDYILIFSHSLKNKLLIEDDFIKSKYISLSEIEDNIDNSNLKHISVFYYGDYLTIDKTLSLPHILINVEKGKIKEILKNYIFKLFNKCNIEIVKNSFDCTHSDFHIDKLKSGRFSLNSFKPIISKYIDQKLLTKFIGRKTDLENIIRKIIENEFNTNLLTIKGSGGIGKTTIICKAAIELANRKKFINGIHFVSCQSVKTIDKFYYQISECFNLTNSTELLEQIKDNISDKSRLIILDNFETLLNTPDVKSVIDLVSFITDYSTVVVTSRQLLDLEFEDVYELRNFTTEEGVLLFKSYYPNVKSDQDKILKEEIIERILNNNPLAIKLIAKGLVKSKDLFQLKEELEDNVFKDEDIDKIFENPEDRNIEKSNSLFQSINYSYKILSEKEKFTFELLSLFPDGIHLSNFKSFIKQSKRNKLLIGEKEIKSLDNKSLLENSNAFLKLQSIISRFTDFQFSKRPESVRKDFYTTAYDYNNFFIKILGSNKFKRNLALTIQNENSNNYLKMVDHLELIETTKEEKLLFINNTSKIFRNTNQSKEIFRRANHFYRYFEEHKDAKLFLDTMLLLLKFWTLEFKQSFNELKKIVPLENIDDTFYESKIQKQIVHNASLLYANMGYDAEIIQHRLNIKKSDLYIVDEFFKIGYIEETKDIKLDLSQIFYFENKQIRNKLTVEEIDKYLLTCHPKDIVEIMQITYVKLKYFGGIVENDIKKMVETNPYTKGIKKIMYAIIENEAEKKKSYFEEAIDLLKDIRYYYVDSIILFCQFLKETNDSDFSFWLEEGLKTAKNHKFRYLLHVLNILKTGIDEEYLQENYEQIVPYEQVISYLKKESSVS